MRNHQKRSLEQNLQRKFVIFNGVSALLLVFFWFLLYWFFENHGWMFFSKEECLLMHQTRPWEDLNILAFCIVYFLIELVNYIFVDVPFCYYVLVQIILDGAIFFGSLLLMEKLSWYVPVTGVEVDQYTRLFRPLVSYFQQYILAFFLSNILMMLLQAIRTFFKER